MDVSGDDDGEQKYIAIVIGQDYDISQLSNRIGHMRTHMTGLPKKEKQQIVQRIQTGSQNILAFCIIMNKKEIVESIHALRRIRRKNYPISKIRSVFERSLFQKIKSRINDYCLANNESITNVRFECDYDCRPLARANSLSTDIPKDAHKISDIIAWCNHSEQMIDWVNHLDLTSEIPVSMKKLLKLN